jgi:hypothetical protein
LPIALETVAKPLFDRFGTSADQKRHVRPHDVSTRPDDRRDTCLAESLPGTSDHVQVATKTGSTQYILYTYGGMMAMAAARAIWYSYPRLIT